LEPYKNYLEGNDEYKAEVQLDATLWHYKKLLDKLFSHNEIEMFAFRDYKFHWEIMHELGSIHSMKEKYRRLCLTKVFIQDFLYTNEQGFQLFPEWDQIKVSMGDLAED
jgi:two-component SAPR family response regulator